MAAEDICKYPYFPMKRTFHFHNRQIFCKCISIFNRIHKTLNFHKYSQPSDIKSNIIRIIICDTNFMIIYIQIIEIPIFQICEKSCHL